MTIWTALRQTYGNAWRFLFALPLIAIAVVGFEGLQHLAEWNAGMYGSLAQFKSAAEDPGRMITGSLKVIWLLVIQYWVTRFVAGGGSARVALTLEPVALRKFAWVFLYSVVSAFVILFIPTFYPAGSPAHRTVAVSMALVELVTLPIGVVLVPWMVGAACGDPRASPIFGIRRAWGSILWGLAVSIVAVLPLMAVHYAFSFYAIGRAPGVTALMLVTDAIVVGFLSVVMCTNQVAIASRMAWRAGETLECSGDLKLVGRAEHAR